MPSEESPGRIHRAFTYDYFEPLPGEWDGTGVALVALAGMFVGVGTTNAYVLIAGYVLLAVAAIRAVEVKKRDGR